MFGAGSIYGSLDLGVVDKVGELMVVIAAHGEQCQTESPAGTHVAVPMPTAGERTASGWRRRDTVMSTFESRGLCEVVSGREKLAISRRGSADVRTE